MRRSNVTDRASMQTLSRRKKGGMDKKGKNVLAQRGRDMDGHMMIAACYFRKLTIRQTQCIMHTYVMGFIKYNDRLSFQLARYKVRD